MTTPPQPGPPLGQQPHYPPTQTPRNGFGITALVLALVGLVFGLVPLTGFLALILGALAVLFGLLGWARTRRGEATNPHMTTIGTGLGVLAAVLGIWGMTIVFGAVDELDKAFNDSTAPVYGAQSDPGLTLSEQAQADLEAWRAREAAGVPWPAATTTPTPKPEYPKEVPIRSVDSRFRTWLGSDRGKTVAVQLAPGVYAEQSTSGELGTLADYSGYVGLCVDVNRYAERYPGGHVCW